MDKEFKSGFVAIVGEANVGKSSLLNELIKQKISIVSPKPQTTRNKISGVLTDENYQIVFVDTPGIHKEKNKLDFYMTKAIESSVDGVDVVLYMLDGMKRITEEDIERIKAYSKAVRTIVAINKMDSKNIYNNYFPELVKLNQLEDCQDIIPISVYKKRNIDLLLETILKYIPQGIPYYPEDEVTDVTMQFTASEFIRESALKHLDQEVPHGIAVLINSWTENEKLIKIDATVICEKQSHKNIIIGKNGQMMKTIGQESRKYIEDLVGKQVYLELWVKVKDKWRDDEILTKNMGYNKNKL